MRLPDDVAVVMVIQGVRLEFRASALQQGCERLFPGSAAADEFAQSVGLPAAVAREAASALDAAAVRFLRGFEASLSAVLVRSLDGRTS